MALPVAPSPQQVYADPQWTRATNLGTSQISQLLMQYGITPDQGALNAAGIGDMYDPSVLAGAQANPYSIAHQLQNTRDAAYTNNATSANARGGLFSGAFQNMQDQAGRNYQQAYSTDAADLLGKITGIGMQREGLYGQISQQLMANQPTADPTVSTASAYQPAAGVATGAGTGYPTPQQAYTRTGPEAGWATPAPPTVKALPMPKVSTQLGIGGMGHVT